VTQPARPPSTGTIERPGDASDEWSVDQLDVEAYLARIGHADPLDATVETLFALHRAHALTIPFENLDIILGRGVSLDLDTLQDKLLRRRRGGYCFEHNLLFAALLERAGFTVRRHLGRVLSADPIHIQPRTHMTLHVDAGGTTWHADVGFGTALSEPIPLKDGVEVTQGGWRHGLTRRADGAWALRSLGPEGWSERYVYTQERQHHVDYVAASHFTSTYPGSHFVQNPVAVRLTPQARHRLNGLELATATPDGTDERRKLTPRDLDTTLRQVFGIELDPSGVDRIAAALAP
jgi:N-hydroxyarylamine O-acetyltransferase